MTNQTNITANLTQTIISAAHQTRIISWMPDGVLFLIIGFIALIIYFYLPDDIKRTIKGFLKKYGFHIVVFLLWIYFRKRWGFVFEYPKKWPASMYRASFYALVIFMIYYLARWLMYEQRYFTRTLISNNISGSCNRFQEVGDWVVFFVGTTGSSTEKIVLPWPLPQKLVVVPKIAVDWLGEHIYIKSQIFKRDLIDLPEEVAHFIETDIFARLCKNEIYFGLWDEKIRASNPDYNEIEGRLLKLNSRINELRIMLKGKLTDVRGFISDTLGAVEKMRKPKWWERQKTGIEE